MVTDMDADQESGGELLDIGRLVPIGREGNKVFARVLRPGEEDTGETVRLEAGDQLVIPAGGLFFDSRVIDARSPKGLGGYAPVANTVWTWYQIAPARVGFFLHLFSLARRIDSAHALWALAMRERERAAGEQGIGQRAIYFNALGTAEVAIIALHRGLAMIDQLDSKFGLELEISSDLSGIRSVVEKMRHSFEHIDDRAEGKAGLAGKFHPDALTVFHQPYFIDSGSLHYGNDSLDFAGEFLAALLECRELIMKTIDARVASGVDRDEDKH